LTTIIETLNPKNGTDVEYVDNMCQKIKDVFVKKDILNHYQQYY